MTYLLSSTALAAAASFWLAGGWEALGMPTRFIDSLTFHLPDIARWIQTGSFWGFHQFVPLQIDGYYPQTGDVFFLAVIQPWMNDAFVNGVNVVLAWVGALATYAIARELGTPRPQSVLSAVLFLSLPILVSHGLQGRPDGRLPGPGRKGSVNRRPLLGLALSVIGLALALVSGLAEVIGLGDPTDPTDSFGWKQIVGLALGVVLLIAGSALAWRARRSEKGNSPQP
jgi:hypothetical protein